MSVRQNPMRLLQVAALALVAACDGSASRDAATAPSEFDSSVAMTRVAKQVDAGPRIPGSAAHRAIGDWIAAELRSRADTVIEQAWTHTTADGKKLPLRNILARFRPQETRRVLYLAHWDSRPVADEETDPALIAAGVPGANDGASGVVILLGVADALKKLPPSVGVDLLFVDGEDWGSFDTNTDVLLGSKYFAEHLPDAGYAPMLGVLWDMVGDSIPHFEQEANSIQAAPEVVQRVWTTAQRLGHGAAFTNRQGQQITDDHVPLIQKGLRVIDVIDLDYPWHHRAGDTTDKVSATTLQVVGEVAMAVIRGF